MLKALYKGYLPAPTLSVLLKTLDFPKVPKEPYFLFSYDSKPGHQTKLNTV